MDFAWQPNLVAADAPEYANLVTKATLGPEQRLNLSSLPVASSWTLTFSQMTRAERDAIKRHYEYHKGDWKSFDWILIPDYVELPNLAERYCPDGLGWDAETGATMTVIEDAPDPYGGSGSTGIVSSPGSRDDTLRVHITPAEMPTEPPRDPTSYTLDMWVESVAGSVVVYCGLLDLSQTIAADDGWTNVRLQGPMLGTPQHILVLRAVSSADTINCRVYQPAIYANRLHVRWKSLKITPSPPDLWKLECVFTEAREAYVAAVSS